MFFLYESIFVFIPYLIGLTLLKKCCLNWEYRKRYKMGGRGGGVGGWPCREIVYRIVWFKRSNLHTRPSVKIFGQIQKSQLA